MGERCAKTIYERERASRMIRSVARWEPPSTATSGACNRGSNAEPRSARIGADLRSPSRYHRRHMSYATHTAECLVREPSPHYHGHRSRLRERFLEAGFDGLAKHEVIELLLTLAIPRSDLKQPAKALLERFGDLRGILDASFEELCSVRGIGSVAPAALKIIRAAATLYLQQSATKGDCLTDRDDLIAFWRMRIGALPNEVFQVAFLDSGHHLLKDGVETLQEGTVDRAAVYPRRVIESALRRNAAAIVIAHNHPSGDTTPSEQDKLTTRAIVLAAATVGIEVLDHLVVSADRAFSFRREGLL